MTWEGAIDLPQVRWWGEKISRRWLESSSLSVYVTLGIKSLSAVQMVDVHIPITNGRELILPRYTKPDEPQQIILDKLNLCLPKQPPPRIRGGQAQMPTAD